VLILKHQGLILMLKVDPPETSEKLSQVSFHPKSQTHNTFNTDFNTYFPGHILMHALTNK